MKLAINSFIGVGNATLTRLEFSIERKVPIKTSTKNNDIVLINSNICNIRINLRQIIVYDTKGM